LDNLKRLQEEIEFAMSISSEAKVTDQRSPTSVKIDKLRNFPSPTSKKELDSFIGIAGQYRELIENFSAKAQCLYELKKKSTGRAKFVWLPKHEAAFKELKDELTKPPVVALPDCSKPF